MDKAFWQRCWSRQQIGFHQGKVNRMLEKHLEALRLRKNDRILVPLCGKAVDMLWLHKHGYRVLGVELVEAAVQDFFAEWGVQPEIS